MGWGKYTSDLIALMTNSFGGKRPRDHKNIHEKVASLCAVVFGEQSKECQSSGQAFCLALLE